MSALPSTTFATDPSSQTTCHTSVESGSLLYHAIADDIESRPYAGLDSLFLKPPILDNLLLHLPTCSLFDLYHTSKFLRTLLQNYPLAWRSLSFRLLPAAAPANNASGFDSPTETSSNKRPHALDSLLRYGLPPKSHIRLTRLDLDNTSVVGTELHTNILTPHRSVLKHLSVRGCKEVSIKYHILPFLTMNLTIPADLNDEPLALKSLYTYRCRHHRRRPYLPSSLNRRDSDSHPTHQLIEICHRFGIWTDTAWCPTPGGRCFRRKDYWIGRSGFGAGEVWVPFDRLWRSQNFLGPTSDLHLTTEREKLSERNTNSGSIGRLWDEQESGYGGEPLGSGIANNEDGKELPAHERRSHRAFVEGYKCSHCGDTILERCEQCSVRMHCAGCRKTLCHSCAFDRPMRKRRRQDVGPVNNSTASSSSTEPSANDGATAGRRVRRRPNERYWWAPGATRSPNIMSENTQSDDSSSDDDNGSQSDPPSSNPRLEMHWCCLKPTFSGGGGIGFMGTPNGDNVRAAPLPQGCGFEDADFASRPETTPKETSSHITGTDGAISPPHRIGFISHLGAADTALFTAMSSPMPPYQSISQPHKAPRLLCNDCYNSPSWRVTCKACNTPICIEHDIKQLKARRCGFKKLDQERKIVQQVKTHERGKVSTSKALRDAHFRIFLAKWKPIMADMEAADHRRRAQSKWVPEQPREVDCVDSIDSLLTSNEAQSSENLPLRRTQSLTTLPSHTHSADPLTSSPPSPSPHRALSPCWSGCGAFLCPSPRTLGDPRPRCSATETSNAPTSPALTQSPGQNGVSTVTTTTNFAAHVAAHHPNALPFVANMGALGNMTLAPGSTLTFLYGPGFLPIAQGQGGTQSLQQLQINQQNLHATQAQALQQLVPGPLNGPPPPGNQVSAIVTQGAGNQQHVRGGVIHNSAGSNHHEALRCAACSILVCGDCRRESPCCPCTACSPASTTPSYAQATTGAGSNVQSTSTSPAGVGLEEVILSTPTQVLGSNAPAPPTAPTTTGATAGSSQATPGSTTNSAFMSTKPSPPSIESFTAQQLCPNCRADPVITSRCRFSLETSNAMEALERSTLLSSIGTTTPSVGSTKSGPSPTDTAADTSPTSPGAPPGDEITTMIDDGSWTDFWTSLTDEPVAPAAEELGEVYNLTDDEETQLGAIMHGSTQGYSIHTTPPPAPPHALEPPTIYIQEPPDSASHLGEGLDGLEGDDENGTADGELGSDIVEGIDDVGDESSAEGTVDDVIMEEDVMGMEG